MPPGVPVFTFKHALHHLTYDLRYDPMVRIKATLDTQDRLVACLAAKVEVDGVTDLKCAAELSRANKERHAMDLAWLKQVKESGHKSELRLDAAKMASSGALRYVQPLLVRPADTLGGATANGASALQAGIGQAQAVRAFGAVDDDDAIEDDLPPSFSRSPSPIRALPSEGEA